MPQPDPDHLAFNDVVIDFAGRRLLRGGAEQALEPKAFAVLALLAASPGRVFGRDEILDAVWGHRHVTQSVINRIMSLLRQALGEDAQRPRLLHTVYGIGYRFDLPSAAPSPAEEASAIHPVPEAPAASSRPGGRRRPLALAATILLLLAAGGWLYGDRERGGGPSTHDAPRPSLAVLPFADLSPRGDQAYLADGLAEEIRNQLAQAPALQVVGRTSSSAFKGKDEDPRAVGRSLDVAYLLEGSLRRDRDRLRVTARLVRADTGRQVWSETYARELRDVFAVQEDISRNVALALSVALDVARYNREQGGTTHIGAYERYLRWRDILMQGRLDVAHDRERVRLAREMVALDPQCVLCWDALARSLNALALEEPDARGALQAESAHVRARIARIAPDSWIARRDRANAWWRQGRRADAIALARQVAEAGPATQERVWDYAFMLYAMGHLDETIALVEGVRAIEPMALYLSRDLQFDYTAARRFPQAEAEYLRGQHFSGSQLGPDFLAFCGVLAGRRAGGLERLRALHGQLLAHREMDTPFFRDLGATLGNRGAMLAQVRRAVEVPAYGGGPNAAFVPTGVADALGDADLAVAAMRRELEAAEGFDSGTMAQQPYVAFWNAPYSGVRSHPQFKAMLVKAGVVDYWRQTGRWGDGCGPAGADDFQCR